MVWWFPLGIGWMLWLKIHSPYSLEQPVGCLVYALILELFQAWIQLFHGHHPKASGWIINPNEHAVWIWDIYDNEFSHCDEDRGNEQKDPTLITINHNHHNLLHSDIRQCVYCFPTLLLLLLTEALLDFPLQGFVHLAMQSHLPIVPIVLTGTHLAWRKGSLHVRPAPLTVKYLPPIKTDDWTADKIDDHVKMVHDIYIKHLPQPQRPLVVEEETPTKGWSLWLRFYLFDVCFLQLSWKNFTKCHDNCYNKPTFNLDSDISRTY